MSHIRLSCNVQAYLMYPTGKKAILPMACFYDRQLAVTDADKLQIHLLLVNSKECLKINLLCPISLIP